MIDSIDLVETGKTHNKTKQLEPRSAREIVKCEAIKLSEVIIVKNKATKNRDERAGA